MTIMFQNHITVILMKRKQHYKKRQLYLISIFGTFSCKCLNKIQVIFQRHFNQLILLELVVNKWTCLIRVKLIESHLFSNIKVNNTYLNALNIDIF